MHTVDTIIPVRKWRVVPAGDGVGVLVYCDPSRETPVLFTGRSIGKCCEANSLAREVDNAQLLINLTE